MPGAGDEAAEHQLFNASGLSLTLDSKLKIYRYSCCVHRLQVSRNNRVLARWNLFKRTTTYLMAYSVLRENLVKL